MGNTTTNTNNQYHLICTQSSKKHFNKIICDLIEDVNHVSKNIQSGKIQSQIEFENSFSK